MLSKILSKPVQQSRREEPIRLSREALPSADLVARVATGVLKEPFSKRPSLIGRCTLPPQTNKRVADCVSVLSLPPEDLAPDLRGSCILPLAPHERSERTFPKEVAPSTEKSLDRVFHPEKYLTTGEAFLWICSKGFGKRIGQKVPLRKEVPEEVSSQGGKKKVKTRLVSDEERQHKLNEVFARLKCVLGLTKEDVVRYSISHNFIEIYEKERPKLKGKYDLLNGGVRELLRDRGREVGEEEMEALIKEMDSLSARIKTLVHRESGGRFWDSEREIFEDALPLDAPHSEKNRLVLENAKRFGLVDEKTMTLNERGLSAVTFIYHALALQKMLFRNINRRQREVEEELVSERLERNRKEILNKEKKSLERFREVIRKVRHFEDLKLVLMAFSSEKRFSDLSQIEGKTSAEMAQKILSHFEQIAYEHHLKMKKKGRLFWPFKKKDDVEIDLEHPFYQKMYRMANRLAGVVFDIREKSLSRLKKIEFFERKTRGIKEAEPQSKFVQFLVHGALSQGKSGEDVFQGEGEWIDRLSKESLKELSEKWPSLEEEARSQLDVAINVSLGRLEKRFEMNLDGF